MTVTRLEIQRYGYMEGTFNARHEAREDKWRAVRILDGPCMGQYAVCTTWQNVCVRNYRADVDAMHAMLNSIAKLHAACVLPLEFTTGDKDAGVLIDAD